jgi:hypothetical protein
MPTSQEVDFTTSPARSSSTVLIDISVDNDLSSVADIGGDTLVGLVLPSNYTTAAITFQVSTDNSTFVPLYNSSGQVSIANTEAVASRAISLDPADWYGWRYVKVATGTAQTTDDKTITLVTRPL